MAGKARDYLGSDKSGVMMAMIRMIMVLIKEHH